MPPLHRTRTPLPPRAATTVRFKAQGVQDSANSHASAFDVLAHPAAGFPDLRPRPYVERRQVLLDVLADAGPPIVPVWSTTDLDEALLWYEALNGTGVEGIAAKPLRGAYKAGRVWSKIRHADTIEEAAVVGFTGTARHLKASPYGCPTDAWHCPSG